MSQQPVLFDKTRIVVDVVVVVSIRHVAEPDEVTSANKVAH